MSFISKGKLTLSIKRNILSWNIPGEGARRFRIKAGAFTVGRIKPNDVILNHESVSRRHARLVLEDGVLSVEDLASTRGTWIGNHRLKPYARTILQPDDSIWMGQVELKYEHVQEIGIPWLLIGGVVGTLIVFSAFLTWFMNRPPKSISFACPATSYLITLPTPEAPKPPPVLPTVVEETETVTETVSTETPTTVFPEPVVSTPYQFLDLPFPYNGTNECLPGTDERFLISSSRHFWGGEGRINSFFDHQSPIWSREDRTIQGSMVLFTGEFSKTDDYSGHAGYDYSPNENYLTSTPVCAPAAGEVVEVKVDPSNCDNHSIIIRHEVEGVGEFETIYFHLLDDDYFKEMLNRENTQVERYERIGTIGNTGAPCISTGAHLHFEVQFLKDGVYRPVDPYGYFPSTNYPFDEWRIVQSNYLWIHPFPNTQKEFGQTSGEKPSEPQGIGGGDLSNTAAAYPEICSPPDAVPAGGKLFFSLSLSPPPAEGLVSIAKAITFAAQDGGGNALRQFVKPIQITIPYTKSDLEIIKPGSLEIRRLNEEKNEWEHVDLELDNTHNIAGNKNITQPGQYALFGIPREDLIPPHTTITASGKKDPGGDWCGPVTVNISSVDDRNSISELQYSLRDNAGWITLPNRATATHTLQPEGKPDKYLSNEDSEGWYPSGDGRYLIQAFAIDGNGNKEIPSSVLYIVIDPTIPEAQCATETLSSDNSP